MQSAKNYTSWLQSEVEIELPPKVEVVVYTGMTSEQRQLLAGVAEGDMAPVLQKLHWKRTGMRIDYR